MRSHSFLKTIELDGYIQVGSGEMPLNPAKDISLDPAVAHIAKIKKTIASMTLTESLGQSMPAQSLLACVELQAFVHMMTSTQLPVFELHQKQMKLPRINCSEWVIGRVHHIKLHHNTTGHALTQKRI